MPSGVPESANCDQLGLGVIILGAGASSRMGRPKLLLPWGDTTIIGHLLRQWLALRADQIAIVCRPGDQGLHAELDRLAIPSDNWIENPQPERGMFSSIQCAANWKGWKDELAVWAIVLGDQPQLRLDTLRALLAFYRKHKDEICQPAFGGRACHPVLLPHRAFTELKQTRVNTLREFLERSSCSKCQCPLDDPGLEADLDTPEDFKKWSR